MKKHTLIVFLVLGISALHYLTPTHLHHYHAIFQRLYYIPIILAAYYFNLKLSVAYAFFCGVLYMPHIFFQWHFDTEYRFSQYVEISMFFVIASVLGTLFDIRQRQKQQIIRQQQELAKEKRLGLLGKLAAGLAHEIRNPLSGLLGAADILKENIGDAPPNGEFVQIIDKELNRVNKKLNEFLDFARPRQPELVPNNIHDVIGEVLALVRPEADKAGIRIVREFSPDIPLVPMDAEQIKQVVLNVVLNSLKALHKGGRLEIGTGVGDGDIFASFKDNGPGIPENDIESIFEPFFTTKQTGTGLGLSISKQLAEAHGGALFARHKKTGAYFELRLPYG